MPDGIRLTLPGAANGATPESLANADVLGQLLRRDGRMRDLGTEGGDVKLDWIDGVEKALAHPEWLASVEAEAADIIRQGIRHVVWAGMGGSVQTVYALERLGYFGDGLVSVHPLDSTDPATLNLLLDDLRALSGSDDLHAVLERTMMIGVSMGMTSEEPITHLEWFAGLLDEYGIADPGAHIQVMTLPGSYLDRFAKARGSRMTPIQLDAENHTAGRMSSPATRVFLRPVALRLVGDALGVDPNAAFDGSLIAGVLRRCQELSVLSHDLDDAARADLTRTDPFVRLGAWLAENAAAGRNKLVVRMPAGWSGYVPWLEQLVEESLGKGGEGLLIFYDQSPDARFGNDVLYLDVRLTDVLSSEGMGLLAAPNAASASEGGGLNASLVVPLAAANPAGLGEIAALCLGFERAVAVFGYLRNIVFAGQPAVEAYKKYARDLREAVGPVPFPNDANVRARLGSLTLDYGTPIEAGGLTRAALADAADSLGASLDDAAGVLAAVLATARRDGWLGYLDVTFNGELTPRARQVLEAARRDLANRTLGIPGKLRTGPSDYHSTEQSETDGPKELVSVRLVALEHEAVSDGRYSDKFLLAQARGTWQAMADAGRWVLMVTFPRLDDAALDDIGGLFRGAAELLG